MKNIEISFLADSTIDFLINSIKLTQDSGVNIHITNFPISQIDLNLMDKNSSFFRQNYDITIIFESSQTYLDRYYLEKDKSFFAEKQFKRVKAMITNVLNETNSKIILFNLCEINDSIFGNSSSKTEKAFIFQLRKFNYLIAELSLELSRVSIFDFSSIQNQKGRENVFNQSLYLNYKIDVDLDTVPLVSKQLWDIINSQIGKFNKCLILDLDNTLWGGVIGDDGIDKIELGNLGIGKAFSQFQSWIKELRSRGIIICVCSKNFEKTAKEVFQNHPDMKLSLDDISVFMCNWESKVENIIKIQKILNIGFDSMVFIDDNPFERNIVRENIKGITVPEIPEDPALYLSYLIGQNLFESFTYENLNLDRTKLYQAEQKRTKELELHSDLDSFLKSIKMISKISNLDSFNIPRVSQLSMRSNQFNPRTVRYTISELEEINKNPDYICKVFELEDQFGAHGIISFIILNKISSNEIFIENWAMSCRVLNRTMEHFILNWVINFCKSESIDILKAEYVKTDKNKLVENLYLDLNFIQQSERHFIAKTKEFNVLTTFIDSENSYE